MIIDRNGGVVIGFQLYGWYRITVQGSILKDKTKITIPMTSKKKIKTRYSTWSVPKLSRRPTLPLLSDTRRRRSN